MNVRFNMKVLGLILGLCLLVGGIGITPLHVWAENKLSLPEVPVNQEQGSPSTMANSQQGHLIKIGKITSAEQEVSSTKRPSQSESYQTQETGALKIRAGSVLSSALVDGLEVYDIHINQTANAFQDAMDWAIENDIKLLQLPSSARNYTPKDSAALTRAMESGIILFQELGLGEEIIQKNGVLQIILCEDYSKTIEYVNAQHKKGEVLTNDSLKYAKTAEQDSVALVSSNDLDSIELILILLQQDPTLSSYQVTNILSASSDPIVADVGDFGRINLTRALELVTLQNEMKSGNEVTNTNDSTENQESDEVSLLSVSPPSITTTQITTTSITWKVQYITPNAYGNRLELLDLTTSQWRDISNSYYTQNGSYTVNNLQPGNTYMGRLTYYQNRWITVDLNVTTTALNNAAFSLGSITETSVNLMATFPADAVYGNRLEILDRSNNQWRFLTPDYKAHNGTYHVTNLQPSRQYMARMLWYNNEWKLQDIHFNTLSSQNHLNYEYDANGRLKYIKNQQGNLLRTYTYDSNGNLISAK